MTDQAPTPYSGREYPPLRSCYIGRWQPLHVGHIALIRHAFAEGKDAAVGIMTTPKSWRNPFTVAERIRMFEQEFAEELDSGRLILFEMPWIDCVCYGRDCGWGVRHIEVPERVRKVSGTMLRREMADVTAP